MRGLIALKLQLQQIELISDSFVIRQRDLIPYRCFDFCLTTSGGQDLGSGLIREAELSKETRVWSSQAGVALFPLPSFQPHC